MRRIPLQETLTCEFKSDRKCLSDSDLIEAVVCMANGQGGQIYLGVEDDGQITGLHAKHVHTDGLAALIANRTQPNVHVRVELMQEDGLTVACISIPMYPQPVATQDGMVKRRRLQSNGQPECVPYLPHEFVVRQAHFGLLDVSAKPVAGAAIADLDPIERVRLRQFIQRFNGDQGLLELDDSQLDAALGLTVRLGNEHVPSLTGLLLLGYESSLRLLVPTHEIAFQILDGEEVRLNEFSRVPLLRAFEWIETLFKPLNLEQEFQSGLFRVAIPKLDQRAFREAVANAITHRDYSLRGAIHIRLASDTLVISNPGGFVEGVSLRNLLTTEPRPRNPALADALKRIGLVERTGRGVDLIYRGLLRYGRHNPDFSQSDSHSVVLRLSMAVADEAFLKIVLEEEARRGSVLPIDSLIILATLREQRRANTEQLAEWLQKDSSRISASVEPLVESGLLQAHGTGRGRSYTLSVALYRLLGQRAEYTRQAGFDRLQHEQLIRNFIKQNKRITRQDVMDLCHLGPDQAYKTLKRLCDQGVIEKQGDRKAAYYT
ncbi:MAG: ATP-binding protein [Fluviicoccus sp.]|uniref:ATP-binding protein n=1 Tax=Fluviicoccus sp. TaxID=2003552 RepID=UPI00271ADB7B|nr:ATP-binding protein [Fluviicoccus sp.]MDO8332227.1 ATP-binding protein [Fluviicoccus sp.]